MDAESKFKKIAEAKEVLSDSQKRDMYDMTGSTSGFNYSNFNRNDDLDDILQSFLNRRGFGFGGGFTQQPREQRYKGEDVLINITIDIKDAYKGVEKKYKYKRKVTCTHCNGGTFQNCPTCQGRGMIVTSQRMGNMGFIQQSSVCPHCMGTGKVQYNNNNCKHCKDTGLEEREEIVTVQIPRGVTKNMMLITNGMGHQLPQGYPGESGDLKVSIANINCDTYEIDGFNLVRKMDIPILDIITGTNIEITSPMGDKIKVEIPRSCPANTALRVNGYGIPITNQNRTGDIYVVVRYKFPKSLDKSDEKKNEELKSSKNFK